MFLNMLDTLVGAGADPTLSPRRAHLLPKIGLLYTHHVLSATQFDALKRAKPSLGKKQTWAQRPVLADIIAKVVLG
jgi:hypothetical protein